MAEAKIEERVSGDLDRISVLPEDLLVTILLLVPIKDAVATMILSKRWHFIWMMLPRLEFKEKKRYGDEEKKKKSIWWFLDKSLELHKAPVLDNLLIKLGPGCPSDADFGKCLKKAVDRHVRVLKFKLNWSSTVPTRLPKRLYNCETLKDLTLSHKILVDFPSSCLLPSLINLDLLYVVYKEDASLVRFLSSCPVLEYLGVVRNKDDNVTKFSVKSPSLLKLWYNTSLPDEDNDDDDDVVVDRTGRCLVIDTPALIVFEISDISGDSCSIENNMPCLENAFINVDSFPDIDKFKTPLSMLVSLELVMTYEVIAVCSTTIINFPRLKKLSISPHRSDWLEPLLTLLKNAPKLKHLLVDYGYTLTKDLTLSWDQPSSIPGCLSSQLELFEFRQYGDTEEEQEFLIYILANSKCLKTVTISVRPSFDLEKQKLIIKKLRDIAKVSTTSQLLFK